ncbi:MAG: hypothetical protein IJ410_03595 [Oscillospiraceae bacterium]|nr:hypothetical protein [Oscillospiraceae bacterium]
MATTFEQKKKQENLARIEQLKKNHRDRLAKTTPAQAVVNNAKRQTQQKTDKLYVPATVSKQENKKRDRLNYIVNPNYRQTANMGINNPYKQLDYMTDEERNTVTQFVAGKDYNGAEKYLDSIESLLNSRVAEAEAGKMKEFAKEHNALGLAAATMAGLYKPMGYIEGLGQTLANRVTGEDTPIDYNSPAFAGSRLSEAAAEGITEGKSGLEQFLWNAALSMGNQLITMPLGGGATTFMGLQGAADALYDYSRKGVGNARALAGATGMGVISKEIEDKFPNSRLFGMGDDASQLLTEGTLKHIFKAAYGEGREEIAENIISNVWDSALMGEKSDFSTLKNQLMEQGLSEEEAAKQALFQIYAVNSAVAFAGGALSGGVLGGMGSGANYYRASRLGQQYNDADTVNALMEAAEDTRGDSVAFMLAQKNRAKLESKGSLSNADVYRQVAANEMEFGREEAEQQRLNISRLYNQATGTDGDSMVINSLQKVFSGGRLTNNEAEAIINDEFARQMFTGETGIAIPENATMSEKRRAVKSRAVQIARGNAQPVTFDAPAQQTAEERSTTEAVESVKRYGESGQKAFMNAVKDMTGERLTAAAQDFENYYIAGTADLGMNAVVNRGGLDRASAYAAYQSGVNDRRFSRKAYDSKTMARNKTPGYDYKGSVNIDSRTAANLDKVGKRFGVKITVADSLGKGVNGRYNPNKGEFVLSADSEKSLDFIAVHELTHRLRQTSPKEFYDMGKKVLGYMQENNLLTGEVARQAKLYGLQEGSIKYDDMLEEVVADFLGSEYDLQSIVDIMTDQPKGFVQHMIDFISDIINTLKKAVGMEVQTNRLEEIRTALQGTLRAGIAKNSENSYNEGSKTKETGYEATDRKRNAGTVEGISDAGQGKHNIRTAGSEQKEQGLERFSKSGERGFERRKEINNTEYIYKPALREETNINSRVARRWLKKIGIESDFYIGEAIGKDSKETSISKDDDAGTTVEGFVLIGANLSTKGKNAALHEAVHSLIKKNDVRVSAYVNTVNNSFDKESRPGIEMISMLKAAEYTEDEYDEEIAAYFSGWIFSTHYGNNSNFCSNLIKKYSPAFKDFDAVLKTHNEMTHLLLPDEDIRDIRFSMSEPVEETKNLIAVHNLTDEKVKKVLELGGMASPSIAVVKRGTEHSNFGSISFLFNKDTIDPQRDRRNKVYSADAYTPTAPLVEREVNYEKRRMFNNYIADMSSKIFDGAFQTYSILGRYGVERTTQMSEEEIADKLAGVPEVKAAYIADKNIDVKPVYKAREFDRFGNDALAAYIEKVGEQKLASLIVGFETSEGVEISADDMQQLKDVMAAYWGRNDHFGKSALFRKRADKITPARAEQFIRNAWDYYENYGADNSVFDKNATEIAMSQAVDRTDVKRWILPKLDGVLGKAGIYNGKDRFDKYGRDRTFNQLHDEYTLENLVKALNKQKAVGEGVDYLTPQTLQAVTTKEFDSVESVKKRSKALKKVDGEELKVESERLGEQIDSVVTAICEINNNDNYYFSSAVEEAIIKAAKTSRTVNAIRKVFKGEDIHITNKEIRMIKDLYKRAEKFPTYYFEAKPQRAVGFDEVAAAVVPDDMDADIRAQLEAQGVPVIEYKAGDEADRLEKVNSVEDIRFSKSETFADDLKKWQADGSKDKTVFILGETGDVLQGLGAMEQSIYMNGDKINTILKEHPEMTIDIISKIPDILDEPILILKSRAVESKKINTRVVIYSDVKAENGLPVLAVLDLKPVENGLYVDDMQKVNSAYTKEYNPEQFLRNSDVLYIHDNKKRTGRLFQCLGFYNAQLMALTGSIGSISYRGNKVNIKGVPFNNIIGDIDTRFSKSWEEDSGYTVSDQAVKELSKKLIGEYSANMKVTELADKLAVALDYMQEGFGNPDFNFDTAVNKIRSVAREMVESASVVSTEYGGEYLEVRDVIRGTKFYLDDKYKADLTSVGNYGEFHKKYFGKLPLSKKGEHVDKVYLELNEMYPGLFTDDITHPAQQLEKIAEVYDKVNVVVNPYEGYEEDVAETITWQIYDAYFDMPSTQGETELKQMQTKLRVNRNKLKLSNAKIASLKAEKRKLNRELLYKSQMADYFEGQLINEVKSNKLVNEILDIATQFKTWYKGGRDVSYLKHPVLDEYIKELGKIKWRSDIRKASARKIMTVVSKFYTKDVLGDYYEKVVGDRISYVAGNMTTDSGEYNENPLDLRELEALNSVMKAVKKLYWEFDTVRIDGRRQNTRELAKKEYAILDKYGRSDVKTKFFNYLTNKVLTDGLFNVVESRVVYRALEGFHEDGVLTKLHDDMTAGVTKANKLRIDMLKARDEFLKDHKDYRKRLEKEKITFLGKEMSVGQAITMYLTMHREEAQATLTSTKVGSGLHIRDKKGNVSEIQALTDVQRAIKELGKRLKKEDKEFARIARKIFNENARDVKMAADMDILGFTNVSQSKNYIPIKRAGDQIAVAFSDVRRMVRDVASVYNLSFNKATVKHSEKGIEIFDINDLLDNHCGKVAMYAGLTKPLQNFDRVLNANITIDSDGTKYGEQNLREKLNKIWKPVQKGTNSVGGFHNFHSTLMQDVQSRGRGDSSPVVNKVKSHFASAALGANLKEIISQPTGYLMAYQYLSGEAMTRGAAMANDYDSMTEYSDYAVVRDYDKGYLLSESLMDKVDGFAKRFGEQLDWADKFTMGKLWNACRVEVELTQGAKVGTEENYKAAAELLEKVARLTQPNYDASEKSALQRNRNEVISSFAMFSSVQTKQLSRLAESLTKYYMYKDRAAKEPTDAHIKAVEAAKKEVARCNAGVLMMNAGYVLICTLVKAALPKKEEEKITGAKDLTKKMASGLLESYVGIIPLADDVANMLIDGYDAGHFFYSSINDMASALRGMKNFEKDPAKALYNLAVATGQLTGVPTRNISNALKGMINGGASFMDTKVEYEGTKLIFKVFGGEKKASYISLLYQALYDGDKETAKYIIDDMVKRGYTKTEITQSLKKLFAENAVVYWQEDDKENLQKVMTALNLAGLTEKSISSQIKTRQKNIIKTDRAIRKIAKKLSEYRNSDSEYKQRHRAELQEELDKLLAEYLAKGYSKAVVEAAIEGRME